MTEQTTKEERELVEGQVEGFQEEKEAHDKEKGILEAEIERVEEEIRKEEEAQKTAGQTEGKQEERKEKTMAEVRTRFFGMDIQQREAFFAREDVKTSWDR